MALPSGENYLVDKRRRQNEYHAALDAQIAQTRAKKANGFHHSAGDEESNSLPPISIKDKDKQTGRISQNRLQNNVGYNQEASYLPALSPGMESPEKKQYIRRPFSLLNQEPLQSTSTDDLRGIVNKIQQFDSRINELYDFILSTNLETQRQSNSKIERLTDSLYNTFQTKDSEETSRYSLERKFNTQIDDLQKRHSHEIEELKSYFSKEITNINNNQNDLIISNNNKYNENNIQLTNQIQLNNTKVNYDILELKSNLDSLKFTIQDKSQNFQTLAFNIEQHQKQQNIFENDINQININLNNMNSLLHTSVNSTNESLANMQRSIASNIQTTAATQSELKSVISAEIMTRRKNNLKFQSILETNISKNEEDIMVCKEEFRRFMDEIGSRIINIESNIVKLTSSTASVSSGSVSISSSVPVKPLRLQLTESPRKSPRSNSNSNSNSTSTTSSSSSSVSKDSLQALTAKLKSVEESLLTVTDAVQSESRSRLTAYAQLQEQIKGIERVIPTVAVSSTGSPLKDSSSISTTTTTSSTSSEVDALGTRVAKLEESFFTLTELQDISLQLHNNRTETLAKEVKQYLDSMAAAQRASEAPTAPPPVAAAPPVTAAAEGPSIRRGSGSTSTSTQPKESPRKAKADDTERERDRDRKLSEYFETSNAKTKEIEKKCATLSTQVILITDYYQRMLEKTNKLSEAVESKLGVGVGGDHVGVTATATATATPPALTVAQVEGILEVRLAALVEDILNDYSEKISSCRNELTQKLKETSDALRAEAIKLLKQNGKSSREGEVSNGSSCSSSSSSSSSSSTPLNDLETKLRAELATTTTTLRDEAGKALTKLREKVMKDMTAGMTRAEEMITANQISQEQLSEEIQKKLNENEQKMSTFRRTMEEKLTKLAKEEITAIYRTIESKIKKEVSDREASISENCANIRAELVEVLNEMDPRNVDNNEDDV